MGYHSDQIDILEKGTDIIIFSFGSPRILRFKNKTSKSLIYDIKLDNNSFFCMTQNVQLDWLHAVLPDNIDNKNERYSITFRKIKV
jgi:alkylated DNA repair dioxygenase AlkB